MVRDARDTRAHRHKRRLKNEADASLPTTNTEKCTWHLKLNLLFLHTDATKRCILSSLQPENIRVKTQPQHCRKPATTNICSVPPHGKPILTRNPTNTEKRKRTSSLRAEQRILKYSAREGVRATQPPNLTTPKKQSGSLSLKTELQLAQRLHRKTTAASSWHSPRGVSPQIALSEGRLRRRSQTPPLHRR